MGIQQLEQAYAVTRSVLAEVRPDHMSSATPCVSWDVRRLIDHIVGGPHWVAESTTAGVASNRDPEGTVDYSSGDFVTSYDDATAAAVEALRAPGALERVIVLPIGEMPGAAFARVAALDAFAHAWDLAKAIGQSTDLDPALAEQLLEQTRPGFPEQFRGPDGIGVVGPEITVAASAPAADRLAGFLGRTP
jgi:uncharacterized protein (TIGR03086 family)